MAGTPSNAPQPPAPALPFVEMHSDGKGYLTVQAFQMLQYLFQSVGGSGGVIDVSLLFVNAPQYEDTSPGPVAWTPVVQGSATPGAATYSRQWGWTAQLGPMVVALFNVAVASVDGTASGHVQIGGLPIKAALSPGVAQAGWLSSYTQVTMTTGLTQLGAQIDAGSAAFDLIQSAPEWVGLALPASALSATSSFTGGAIFFR